MHNSIFRVGALPFIFAVSINFIYGPAYAIDATDKAAYYQNFSKQAVADAQGGPPSERVSSYPQRIQAKADKCGFVGTEYNLGSLDRYGPTGAAYTSASGHKVTPTLMPSLPKWKYSGATPDTSKPTWFDPVSGGYVPGGFGSAQEHECYTVGIALHSSQMSSYFKAVHVAIDKVTGSTSSKTTVSQTQAASASATDSADAASLAGAELGLPEGAVVSYNGSSHTITDGPANPGCSTPTYTNTVPGKMYDYEIGQSLRKWGNDTNHWQIQKRQLMMGNPLVAGMAVPGESPPEASLPTGVTMTEMADGSTVIKFPPSLIIPHNYSEAVGNAVVDGNETGKPGCQDYSLTHRNMAGTNKMDVTWEYFVSLKGGAASPNTCQYPSTGALRNEIIQQIAVIPSLKELHATEANLQEQAQRLAAAEAEVVKAKDLELRIRTQREAYYNDPANKEQIDKGIIVGPVPEFVNYQYVDLKDEIKKAEQVVRAINYEIENLPAGQNYQNDVLEIIKAEDELAKAKENEPKNRKMMAETWLNPDWIKERGLENSPWIELNTRRMEEAVPNAEKTVARLKLALEQSLRTKKIEHIQLAVARPEMRVTAEALLAECPFTPLPTGTKWTVAEQKYTLPAGITLESLAVTPTENNQDRTIASTDPEPVTDTDSQSAVVGAAEPGSTSTEASANQGGTQTAVVDPKQAKKDEKQAFKAMTKEEKKVFKKEKKVEKKVAEKAKKEEKKIAKAEKKEEQAAEKVAVQQVDDTGDDALASLDAAAANSTAELPVETKTVAAAENPQEARCQQALAESRQAGGKKEKKVAQVIEFCVSDWMQTAVSKSKNKDKNKNKNKDVNNTAPAATAVSAL